MSAAASGIHHRLRQLLTQDASPLQLGGGVALGVMVACTPFFGFQLLLALTLAWPLRLNKVAVALGTQFSIPPLIPFIAFASANLGELILHRRMLPLALDQLRGIPATTLVRQFALSWTVGGLVLGAVAGGILGSLVTVLARRTRAARTADGARHAEAHSSGEAPLPR